MATMTTMTYCSTWTCPCHLLRPFHGTSPAQPPSRMTSLWIIIRTIQWSISRPFPPTHPMPPGTEIHREIIGRLLQSSFFPFPFIDRQSEREKGGSVSTWTETTPLLLYRLSSNNWYASSYVQASWSPWSAAKMAMDASNPLARYPFSIAGPHGAKSSENNKKGQRISPLPMPPAGKHLHSRRPPLIQFRMRRNHFLKEIPPFPLLHLFPQQQQQARTTWPKKVFSMVTYFFSPWK